MYFAVPVPEEEAQRLQPVPLRHGKVPGLLNGLFGGGVGGDAREVDAAGAVFDEDQGVQAL
ncbi:hypothetical protein GCM10009646_81840 [Streptomyces aureus]